MNLNNLAKKYNTDKKIPDGIKCQNGLYGNSYTNHYENILKNKKINCMLEIGVSFGGSIKMWDDFFKNKCIIIGVDIEEKRFKKTNLEKDNIIIEIGDQSDKFFLNKLCKYKYDLIIDDGSHKTEHQIISFNELFKSLNSNGIYIIEDLHVASKTIEIFNLFKNNTEEFKKIINPEYINDIQEIEFLEDNKLCVIFKK